MTGDQFLQENDAYAERMYNILKISKSFLDYVPSIVSLDNIIKNFAAEDIDLVKFQIQIWKYYRQTEF